MGMADAFVQEIDQEGKTTRRLLERVPGDRLGWKPHSKSMTLGELAMHTAGIPGHIGSWALEDTMNLGGSPSAPVAESTDQLLKAHDASVAKAKDVLAK